MPINCQNVCQLFFFNVYLSANRLILRHLAYTFLILAGICGCRNNTKTTIFPDSCRLSAGDVVFRKGEGMTSRVVILADKEGTYSHVGIVVDSAGMPMIVHAVPGEPDFEGDPDRVKMDTPQKFYSSVSASAGEVCRFRGSPVVARRAAAYAMQVYRRGTLFDHGYDDSDTTKMYCCELVEAAYTYAGTPLTDGNRHSLSFPGMGTYRCMLPSDILQSPRLSRYMAFTGGGKQ